MGGTQPWPQVPVGNKDHTDAAVVIIGAGISGNTALQMHYEASPDSFQECAWRSILSSEINATIS